MDSHLYVFEGPDGVGKSTLAAALNNTLNERGLSSVLLSFPGLEPGTVGNHIYQLYHDSKAFGVDKMTVVAEQLLFTAAHVDVIQSRIIPSLRQGINVVLDRYWWSTWVYAHIQKLEPLMTKRLIDIEIEVWSGTRPDFVFLIDRTFALVSKIQRERFEALSALYGELYLKEQAKQRAVLIKNNETVDSALASIHNLIGFVKTPPTMGENAL